MCPQAHGLHPTLGSLRRGAEETPRNPPRREEAGEPGCCFCKHSGPTPNGNTCGCGLLEWPQIPRWVSAPAPRVPVPLLRVSIPPALGGAGVQAEPQGGAPL